MSSPRIHESFPLPDVEWPMTAGFWSSAARGELAIPRGRHCRTWVWYPEPACPGCAARDLDWVPTSGYGLLYTWTVVRHVFLPAFRDEVPYIVGLVAVQEDPGVRLAARILADAEELEVGLAMVVEFRTLCFPTAKASVMAPFWTPASKSPSNH